MDRLTNKKEADAQREAYERRLKQGYPKNIPEERFLKLAAYEDSGLSPEEIKNLNNGIIPNHWSELFIAECEDRLVVLPCKVGDTVWALWDVPISPRYIIYQAEVKEFRIGAKRFGRNLSLLLEPVDFRGRRKEYLENDFGKTVFLTREEAEKALEQMIAFKRCDKPEVRNNADS